jgi:uncharacterized protein
MNCPRCENASLIEIDRQGITIDRCDGCRGVWLDRGELEKLIARESRSEAAPAPSPASAPALAVAGEPPRRYRRAGSDHDDDDDDRDRGHGHGQGKRRSAWWDIFD